MKRFVYVLKNEDHPPRYYTGVTSDVPARLTAHNDGLSPHTATLRPWRLDVVVEFADERRGGVDVDAPAHGADRSRAARRRRRAACRPSPSGSLDATRRVDERTVHVDEHNRTPNPVTGSAIRCGHFGHRTSPNVARCARNWVLIVGRRHPLSSGGNSFEQVGDDGIRHDRREPPHGGALITCRLESRSNPGTWAKNHRLSTGERPATLMFVTSAGS
jgi:putative endonuclease